MGWEKPGGTATGPHAPARKTRNSPGRQLQFSPARLQLVQVSTSQYKSVQVNITK
jgi:hypothetical protein